MADISDSGPSPQGQVNTSDELLSDESRDILARYSRVSRSSVKISLWDEEAINVPLAFAKFPTQVRRELIEAIRHVELNESDINLLMLETVIKSALKKPNSITAEQMLGKLQSFQHDDSKSIGASFHEHGRNYGTVVFVLATTADPSLLARLEALPEQDLILLIQRLTEEPPRDFSKLLTDYGTLDTTPHQDDLLVRQNSNSQTDILLSDPATMSAHKASGLPVSVLDDFYYLHLPEWADFRLVLLERQSNTAEIKCHLIPASSKEHLNYEALSYTWGENATNAQSILINGKRFSVTENLHSALQRLRDGGSGKYRCLWIDSLCIDQSNGKERNHQVSIMGQIYQNAQRVVVWLGEHGNNSEKAIEFITNVFVSSRYQKSKHITSFLYDGDEKYEASAWHAVESLFRRDYWERTWIIQEIQLAKNVFVHCGDRTFDWTAGGTFFSFLQRDRDRHLETDPESVSIKQRVMQAPAIQLLESALVFQKRGMTLKQLLYRHENSLCRETRDKIYGLLALASDCKMRRFEPDYEKDLSGVYRDALGLEMTTSFTEKPTSPDMVYYSHFLQKILGIFISSPEALTFSMTRDPICILGYSCGKLCGVDIELNHNFGPPTHTYEMLDSEFLVHKGSASSDNIAFGYKWDPMKGTIGYTWLEPPDPLKTSSSLPQHNELTQPISPVMQLPQSPIIKTFILPGGQTVITPEVAKEGDEICMFSKHDLAIVMREHEAGTWEIICNAFVLTSEDKRSRRPRKELRDFQYCVPDYDIFPPPTSDPRNSFHVRMSTRTLQWATRVFKS